MYQPDETIRLEVRVEDDTVWLNRQQMATLFGRDVKTIGKHVNNALHEELANVPTVANFAIVQNEGGRIVNRTIEFYSIDMIMSVGYVQIVSLIKQAKHSIILIDNYIDEATLTMLSKRNSNVSATIYTRQLNQQQQLDLQRHNQQYPPIDIHTTQRNHDRFLIIDDVVYLFGASLKDAGKKLFAYIKMQETPAAELLNNIR